MRVLITGFGPFLDNDVNPSDALARALDGRRAHGVRFIARSPLPVEHERAAALALEAARSNHVQAIVALGLAAGTTHMRLETWARNRTTSAAPDTTGRVALGLPVLPGAPGRLPATLRIEPIRQTLSAAGVRSELSADAGGYVCNDLYYRLLHARGWPSLFVHLPERVSVSRVSRPFASGIARAVISSGRDVSR